VPGYANPQGLNRFSYVLNNPLRYSDPTGHRPAEEQGGKRGCSNAKYCQNGKPKDTPKNKDKDKDKDKDKGGGGGHPLATTSNGGGCSQVGSGVSCEINVPRSTLPAVENITTAMGTAGIPFYTAIGGLIGLSEGPGGALAGGIIGASAGAYEDKVISEIYNEFESSAGGTLTIGMSTDEHTYGVVVDGTNDGINNGTLVNTPLAFVTLDVLVVAYTGQFMIPSP